MGGSEKFLYRIVRSQKLLLWFPLYVSDSVNRGTSTARRMQASLYDWIVYQRRYKARERKGEEEQRRLIFYMVLWSRDCYCPGLSETVCDCLPQSTVSTSAVTTYAITGINLITPYNN